MMLNLFISRGDYSNRDNRIDYIKGIAMLMIVFVHSTQKFPGIDSQLFAVSKFGQMGTQIFLVLAAYNSYFSMKRSENCYNFWKKRVGAIIPAWEVSILVYVLINFLIVNVLHVQNVYKSNTDLGGILINSFLLNGLVPQYNNNVVPGGWYIGTLVLLYLCLPAIMLVMNKCSKRLIITFGILLYGMWVAGWIVAGTRGLVVSNNSFMYFSFMNQLPVFCVGIVCAKSKESETSKSKALTVASGLLLILMAIVLFYLEIWWVYCLIPTLFALGFGLFFMGTKNKETYGTGLAKLFCWFGKNSYYVYLTHVLWVFYLPGFIYFVTEKLDVYYSPTLYWALLFIPMIVLSGISAMILKAFVNLLKNRKRIQ